MRLSFSAAAGSTATTPSSGPTSAPEQVLDHHHRNIAGGAARAAVFGVSDGLQTNVALILGVAGAHPAVGVVRLAGLAGLVGGAFSMAAGEYVSMKAQSELLERELALERYEIHRRPETERRELANLYKSRGVDDTTAHNMATQMMSDPDLALETHAREELGINPGSLGSPITAALSSFGSFGLGAVVPLIPWLIGSGGAALAASLLLAAALAIVVGAALSRFTGRSWVISSARQLAIAAIAAGVTFGIGRLVGLGGP
jgi:VIT1/CCC1 family predicted Fe2+/Mn2+ transporter